MGEAFVPEINFERAISDILINAHLSIFTGLFPYCL